MENITQSFILLAPELILSLSAIALLLYGVFVKTHKINTISYLAAFIAFIACIVVTSMPIKTHLAFSDMLLLTSLTQYGKLLILLAITCIYCILPATSSRNSFITYETIPMIMLSAVGMMVTISSNSLLSLYMGLELMSLSSYVLVAINRDSISSSEASVKYFIMGALTSCLYLFGASLLYAATGHIDFSGIRDAANSIQHLDHVEVPILLTIFVTGIVLVITSFAFKISAAPFHMWTPDVYQGSPWIITAFLASAPKVTTLLTLSRILYGIFIPNDLHWLPIISFLSAASMLVGGIGAIMQKSIKRILAYSSIGHIGFALMGLAVSNEEGVTAFIVYITIYLIMNLGVFACLILIGGGNDDKDEISSLSGLGKTNPLLAFGISALMLSMAGIPPLAGFFAKLYIIYGAVKQEMTSLAVIAVISSVLAAYYYLRFIKVMYFEERNKSHSIEYTIPCAFVALIMVLFNLLYVFSPSWLLSLAQAITKSIFDI